eukprot:896507-Amphidinium_carterae.1
MSKIVLDAVLPGDIVLQLLTDVLEDSDDVAVHCVVEVEVDVKVALLGVTKNEMKNVRRQLPALALLIFKIIDVEEVNADLFLEVLVDVHDENCA